MKIILISRKTICYLFIFIVFATCGTETEKRDLPLIGINPAWQCFVPSTSSLPFTNVFKNAGLWEGGEFFEDENGYPKSLKEGQQAKIWVLQKNGKHYPTGKYTLMWDGKGKIRITNCDKEYLFTESDDNVQTIPIEELCTDAISLTILSTDPADHIRNFRLFLPGYDENSGIWTKHYIEERSHYGLTRYMWGSGAWCYMDTVENWDERRQLDDYHWMGGDEETGIPYEAMIELANKTKNDLWICVPHAVTEDFMRKMATLITETLDPDLNFWLEYTNEHWLDIDFFIIAPNDYLQDEIAKNQDKPEYQNITVSHLYARKAIRLFEVFTDVFKKKNQLHRLVRAICGHAADSTALVETTEEIVRMGKMDMVDVFGIGPYFRAEGKERRRFKEAFEKGWDAVFESVNRSLDDMFDPNGYVGKHMYANAALAVKYNKPLVTYEAGQHYTTWTGTPSAMIAPLNRRPEMYDVYIRFLNEWTKLPNASTNVLFSAYAMYDENEAFGMMEYYDQEMSETHKRRAVRDWLKEKKGK
jgi:hypothetical protein